MRVMALSDGYLSLFTVNPTSGQYVEFSSSEAFDSLGAAKQGEDFFADVRIDAPRAIDPRDIDRHLRVLTKENMMREIQENGRFVHNYRLLIDGKPTPVSLKATMVEEEGVEIPAQ